MRLALLYFAMILLTLCLHVLLRSDYRRRIRRLRAVAAGTGDTVSATPFLSVFFPALSALLLCITGIGVLAASPFLSPARLTAVFFVAYATALLCWLPALLTRYGIRQIWMVCPDRLYHPASGEMHHLYEVTFCRLSTHRRYTSFSLLADGDTLRFRLPTGTHADDFLSSLTCPEMTRRTLVRSALPERLLSVLSVLLLILGVLQCTLPFFLPQSITDYRDQTDKGADPTVQYQTPVTLAGPIVFLRGGNTVYVFPRRRWLSMPIPPKVNSSMHCVPRATPFRMDRSVIREICFTSGGAISICMYTAEACFSTGWMPRLNCPSGGWTRLQNIRMNRA